MMDALQPAAEPDLPEEADAAARERESWWVSFHATRDESVRARLAASYQPFVRMLAAKAYARRTGPENEFDDYLQLARVGLMEAIDRFDPGLGCKFETYASARIRGSILDGLEASSEVQQQIAARKRMVASRVKDLAIARPDGKDEPDVFARLADIAIGLAVGFALEDSGMHQAGEGFAIDSGYAGVALRQLRDRVRQMVEALPPRHRAVIYAHYLQHVRFDEIAASMGLTPGRVAQLHREGLLLLRERMRARGGLDLEF
jgi:RNA polymerase sigma factor for flagellar operon FliA